MPWKINHNTDQNIIELTYFGQVTANDLTDAFMAAKDLSQKEDIKKCLADCTDMLGGHSIMNLYAIIELLEGFKLHRLKEALLLPSLQASKKDVEFYETACVNRGFNVKIFNNYQQAVEWLLE